MFALAENQSTVRVILPTPLAIGEEVVIKVNWKDTWPYDQGGCEGELAVGSGSGVQAMLPSFTTGLPGNPWPFRARLHVPEGSKLVGALSGDTQGEGTEGGWRWVEAAHETGPASWAYAAVGRWRSTIEPARAGLPAVRTHLLSSLGADESTFAPEVRRVAGFFQRWLPSYPLKEIEVVESPSRCGGFVWIAPHGLVNLQRMIITGETVASSPRDHQPELESGIFAHELAHQYWGHQIGPASIEDFWIAETFAEVYACMYVGAAFSAKHCTVRLDEASRIWSDVKSPPASLTQAYRSGSQPDIVYRYGPVLFHRMLRLRIGDLAYFGALDLLQIEHAREPTTTERLEAYMSGASQQDLTPFFDFWVRGGHIPSLRLAWEPIEEGGTTKVVGTVTSDVPFGTFDVAVRVTWADGTETWPRVVVTDGTGQLETAGSVGVTAVRLDPDELTLARTRSVGRR